VPVPKAADPVIRRARSGWLPSAPESTIATSAPDPLERSQARWAPSRLRFHWAKSWLGAWTSPALKAKSFGVIRSCTGRSG
jgi:hypothetical protein